MSVCRCRPRTFLCTMTLLLSWSEWLHWASLWQLLSTQGSYKATPSLGDPDSYKSPWFFSLWEKNAFTSPQQTVTVAKWVVIHRCFVIITESRLMYCPTQLLYSSLVAVWKFTVVFILLSFHSLCFSYSLQFFSKFCNPASLESSLFYFIIASFSF